MSLTIETDLKDILNKLDGKMDRMQDSITDLKLGQSELKGKVDSLEKTVDRIQKDVDILKTDVAGLTGIKGLLIPLSVAVTVSAISFALTHIKLP